MGIPVSRDDSGESDADDDGAGPTGLEPARSRRASDRRSKEPSATP
jgi:hypothetical protein